MATNSKVLNGLWIRSGFYHLLIISMASLFVLGCSNDDDNGGEFDFPLEGDNLSISDIAGNWTATFAEFQLVTDASSTIEIVSQGGSVNLNIQNNGRFSATITFPGAPAESFSGQLGFSGSQLVLLDDVDDPGDEAFLTITLTPEDVLLINGILEFDFEGTGSFEATSVDLRMVR